MGINYKGDAIFFSIVMNHHTGEVPVALNVYKIEFFESLPRTSYHIRHYPESSKLQPDMKGVDLYSRQGVYEFPVQLKIAGINLNLVALIRQGFGNGSTNGKNSTTIGWRKFPKHL